MIIRMWNPGSPRSNGGSRRPFQRGNLKPKRGNLKPKTVIDIGIPKTA
jgi:hypothetical protein